MDKLPLVIASGNKGKIAEFKKLLDDFPFDLMTQPVGFEIEETGSTFMENARIKAIAVSQVTGNLSLADDSGLSVESLGGAPGIYSSRYANSDEKRIEKLLAELKPFQNRKDKFECALCVASGKKVMRPSQKPETSIKTFSPLAIHNAHSNLAFLFEKGFNSANSFSILC